MSGGHYSYAYMRLSTAFIEVLDLDIKEGRFDNDGPEIKAAALSIKAEAERMAKRMKAIEWFMSGDTGVEPFLEALKDHE